MTALVQGTPLTFYSLNNPAEEKAGNKIRETGRNQIMQDLENIVGSLEYIFVAVYKGKDQEEKKENTF